MTKGDMKVLSKDERVQRVYFCEGSGDAGYAANLESHKLIVLLYNTLLNPILAY